MNGINLVYVVTVNEPHEGGSVTLVTRDYDKALAHALSVDNGFDYGVIETWDILTELCIKSEYSHELK